MFENFYHMSDLCVFFWINGITILISIIAIVLVKMFMPLHIRYQDNQVIGTTAQLIGLVYGVLAGLTALYLINNNNATIDSIQREANSIANIYRYSTWLDNKTQVDIKISLEKYLDHVIHVEWPKMSDGVLLSTQGDGIIDQVFNDLKHYPIKTTSDGMIVGDILREIENLYNARQQRIQLSYAQLDPAIWIVVIIGTVLTLCINYLFGMNFYFHMLMVVSAALITSSMIFLLVVLDRPFQGEHIVEPTALLDVYQFIERQK